MNKSWKYSENVHYYKSTNTLIQELIKVVSRDGNFLLNISQKGDGTVPEETADALKAIGKWMSVNGESIYGATRSQYRTVLK